MRAGRTKGYIDVKKYRRMDEWEMRDIETWMDRMIRMERRIEESKEGRRSLRREGEQKGE